MSLDVQSARTTSQDVQSAGATSQDVQSARTTSLDVQSARTTSLDVQSAQLLLCPQICSYLACSFGACIQCSCKYLAAFLQKSVCFECGQEATNPLFKMYSRRACRALNVQLTFLSVTNRTGTCVHIYYTMLTWSEPRPLMHSVKIGEMTGFKKQQQQQQQQQKNAGRWNWIDRLLIWVSRKYR